MPTYYTHSGSRNINYIQIDGSWKYVAWCPKCASADAYASGFNDLGTASGVWGASYDTNTPSSNSYSALLGSVHTYFGMEFYRAGTAGKISKSSTGYYLSGGAESSSCNKCGLSLVRNATVNSDTINITVDFTPSVTPIKQTDDYVPVSTETSPVSTSMTGKPVLTSPYYGKFEARISRTVTSITASWNSVSGAKYYVVILSTSTGYIYGSSGYITDTSYTFNISNTWSIPGWYTGSYIRISVTAYDSDKNTSSDNSFSKTYYFPDDDGGSGGGGTSETPSYENPVIETPYIPEPTPDPEPPEPDPPEPEPPKPAKQNIPSPPKYVLEAKTINKNLFYFGIDKLSIKSNSLFDSGCIISDEIDIAPINNNTYIVLDTDDNIFPNTSVEYYIIDGNDEIPILPYNYEYIREEKVFSDLPLRFTPANDELIVYKNGTLIDSIPKTINSSDIVTVSYIPIPEYKYYPKTDKIKIKVILRKYPNATVSPVVNSVQIKKYGGGSIWRDIS